MYKMMCLIIFFAFSVLAGDLRSASKRQEVIFLDDHELDIGIIPELIILNKFFDVRIVVAPSTRHWQLISKYENFCFTRTMKTALRKNRVFFSLYPISYNYPHILVINKYFKQISPVNILDLVNKNNTFKIGKVNKYSHGASLDKLISKIPVNNLMELSTSEHPQITLYSLLKVNRLDAILTSRSSFYDYLNAEERDDYVIANIEGVTSNEYGYLVCSKSSFGKHVIAKFNKAMQNNKIRADFFRSLEETHGWLPQEVEVLRQKYLVIDKSLNSQNHD